MKKTLLVTFAIMFVFVSFCYALETPTHEEINDYVARNTFNGFSLDSYLIDQLDIQEGIEEIYDLQAVWQWLRIGGLREDKPSWDIPYRRSVNHFHNPLTDEGYTGIWGTGFFSGESSIQWSQEPIGTQDPGGHYSWHDVRDYFYRALTSENKTDRERNFADTFRGLGQLMHLVHDLSVPEHARDDGHIGYIFDNYETWVRRHHENIWEYSPILFDPASLGNPNPLASVPVANLFDTNQYIGSNPDITLQLNIGLSEYTNANFFSGDTVFSSEFPYPNGTSVSEVPEDSEIIDPRDPMEMVTRKYFIKDKHGDTGYRLSTVPFLGLYLSGGELAEFEIPAILDDLVYEGYAEKLIPRAVGYSAGLLDYFFRGIMDVQDVSLQRDGSGNITGLDMSVKNVTPLGQGIEPMSGGSLSLAYEYTLLGQDEPVYGHVEEIYTIMDASDLINSEYVPVDISMAEPIPSTVQELTYTLIYRGKLGDDDPAVVAEDDAVVAKVLPFTYTSRIAFSFQQGGPGNVSNIYTIFPDGTGEIQISDTSDGRLYDFNPSWSPDGKMLAFDAHTDDPFNSDIIVIDMTSPEPYPNNILTILDSGGAEDEWHDFAPSFSSDGEKIVAVKSESEFTDILIIFDIASGSWEVIPNTLSDWINGPPKMSPQGDKIVYSADEWTDSGIIWLMNPDGTAKVNLTDDDYHNYDPDWSPDGEWIVFVSDRDGGDFLDLWIMDRTGGNMRQIAGWGTSCRGPSFSPDGESIVFTTLGGIYIINIDGSGLTELTAEGYFTGRPDWSPLTFIYGG